MSDQYDPARPWVQKTTFSIAAGRIVIDEREEGPYMDLSAQIRRRQLDTTEAHIRAALISMGWTPPPGSGPDAPVMVVTVSADLREVGVEHEAEANWDVINHAHKVAHQRLAQRIAAAHLCPARTSKEK